MSEWVACPTCGGEVHNSYSGWERHSAGPKHALVLMGLSPDEADRIVQACAAAGIAYEAAMSAVRFALHQSPQELARKAEALREFAGSVGR